MAKTPRPSISDQLAQISASAPPQSLSFSRDNVQHSQVSRDNLETDSAVADDAQRGNPTTGNSSRDHVPLGNRPRGNVTADGFRVRQRIEKPHVSLYAHPRVLKKVREIAAAEGCKAHDIYVEGLRLVLARYGLDYDKLDRGEV